ncbi:MAG TPA: hypothetical protein VGS21_05410, partial [Acidimicrobiales bacterium]|nr:hypothetical protein [Acidimicrobiales bacterium]
MADGGPQRILYVAPEVVHGPNQRLDSPKEWKTIEAEIRKSTRRDDLELLSPLTAAGLDDLIGRIIATRPHVLHITSHGEVGQLLLRDDLGRERPLSHDDLAKIITEHAP